MPKSNYPEQQTPPKAVVLLSGGLDSSTVLALATSAGYECHCLSFAYGQRQNVELKKARDLAKKYSANHLVLNLDLEKIGGSALTTDQAVPKGRTEAEMSGSIPATYVPGRNIIFLAHALSWAEVLGANDIFIGINVMDYSGYPDCRPEFIEAFARMAKLGTKAGVEGEKELTIHAPLMRLTKKEIIEKGISLGVDYGATHSCYDPDAQDRACGQCDACLLRLKGFAEAGLTDPAIYQESTKKL
ncbi:MAG: 7-cyano-7-deazaguanine synthase QueC [Proteobacteria bacterium]|nr:7-cyano-7-deazaguanine synthase QueC [Pseudomonadota bacterium]MBU1717132.1 7-cyano-7-deazaguanine synthase QueC [Pseudomonadota bacterium]